MIKKNQRQFNWINRLTDMFILIISYVLAVWFWIFLLSHDDDNIAVYFIAQGQMILLLFSFAFISVFQYGGIYDSFRFRTIFSELLQLLKMFFLCCISLVGCIFLFKLSDFSRGVIGFFAVFGYVLLCAKRVFLRLSLRYLRRKGYNQKHVLIVGSGYLAEKFLDNVNDNPQYGFNCIGYVSSSRNKLLGEYLGDFTELDKVLERTQPDEVVIALEQYDISMQKIVLLACEEQGVRTNIIPICNDFLPDCASLDVLGTVKLINVRSISLDIDINRALKRIEDLLTSLVAIILVSPLMLIVALAVKLTSPGPIIFKQKRVGFNGDVFMMYKFRSMVQNNASDTAWSMSRDCRVTPVGAFIRKLSIDELPQLFNVLEGKMSIVGPRPELPHFVEQYRYVIPRYMVKHQVKPGITGWAQVNGYRGNTSIEKRIEHDIWYIENWSLLLDIRIMLMTVFGGMVNREKNLQLKKRLHD